MIIKFFLKKHAFITLVSLVCFSNFSCADDVKLEDIQVTANRYNQSRMNIPANTTTVTREDVERSGARTLEEALRAVPGLQIGTQGNAYPHVAVRGFRDTKDLAVLIDGIPFRQVGGGGGFDDVTAKHR